MMEFNMRLVKLLMKLLDNETLHSIPLTCKKKKNQDMPEFSIASDTDWILLILNMKVDLMHKFSMKSS